MSIQPLFYFPSTSISVDDHQESLTAICRIFQKTHTINTFKEPKKALAFLKDYRAPLSSLPFLRALTDENIDLPEYCPVDFNVLNISQLIDYTERQKEISVLIIDLNMPEINGLDICRAIKGSAMKKILLTGESDYLQAIAAFNENIIDHFIQKDSKTISDDLIQSVNNLTHQYFFERTKALQDHLETREPLPLSDKKFILFFQNWRKENNITEYYLIDKTGSFLCIDATGKKLYFVIHTNKTLNTFVELYEEETEDDIPLLMESIRCREKIPFFGIGQSAWQKDTKTWKNYFYPAEILEGRETYYWAAIK